MNTSDIKTQSKDLNLLLNFDYNERIPDKFRKIIEDDDTKSFSTLAQEIIYECYGDISNTDKHISDENIQPGTEKCPGQNKLNYLVGGPILPKPRNREHHPSYGKETYKPDEYEDEDYWKSDQDRTKEEVKNFYKNHENEIENPVPVTEFNYLSRESQDRKNCEDTIQKLMLQLRKHELKSKKILEMNVKITEKLNTVVICMGEFQRVFKSIKDKRMDLGEDLNKDIEKSYKISQTYNKPSIKKFINELVQKSKTNEQQLATSSYKVLRYDTMVKICESLQLEVQFCRKAFGFKNLIVPDFDFTTIHTKKDWTDKIPLDNDNLRKKLITYRLTDDVYKLKTYYNDKLLLCADVKEIDDIFPTMLESDKAIQSESFDQVIDDLVKKGFLNKEEGESKKTLRRSIYNIQPSMNESCSIASSVKSVEDIDKLEKDMESIKLPLPYSDRNKDNAKLKDILDTVVDQIESDLKNKISIVKENLSLSQKEDTSKREGEEHTGGSKLSNHSITGGANKSVSSEESIQSQETLIYLNNKVKRLEDELKQKNIYNKSLGIALDSNYLQNNTIKLKTIYDIDKESFYQELIESLSTEATELIDEKKEEINNKLQKIEHSLTFEADEDKRNKLEYEKYICTQTLKLSNLSKASDRLREIMNRPDEELDSYLYSRQQYRILNYSKNEILNRYRHVPWKLSVYFEILNIQNRSILLDESLSYQFSFNERNRLARRLEQSNEKLLEGFILKEEEVIESRNQLNRNPIFYQQLEEAFMDGMNHTLNNIKYDDVINFHDIKNIFNSIDDRKYKVDVLDNYQSYIYHPKTMFLPIDNGINSKQLSIKKLGFSGMNDKGPIVVPEIKSNKSKSVKLNEGFSEFLLFFKNKIQNMGGITPQQINEYVSEFYNKFNLIHSSIKNNELKQFSEVYSFIFRLITIFTGVNNCKLDILLKYKLTEQKEVQNFKDIDWTSEDSFNTDGKNYKEKLFLVLQNYFSILNEELKKIFIEKLKLDEYLVVITEEEEPGTESAIVNRYVDIFNGEYSNEIIKDDTKDRLIELLFGYFLAFIGDNWNITKHDTLSTLIKKLLLSIYTELTESQIEVLKNQYWDTLVNNKLKIISMTEEEKVTLFYVNNMDNSVLFSDVEPIEKEDIDGLTILDEAIKLVTTKAAERMATESVVMAIKDDEESTAMAREDDEEGEIDDDFDIWADQVLEEIAAEAKEKERLAPVDAPPGGSPQLPAELLRWLTEEEKQMYANLTEEEDRQAFAELVEMRKEKAEEMRKHEQLSSQADELRRAVVKLSPAEAKEKERLGEIDRDTNQDLDALDALLH